MLDAPLRKVASTVLRRFGTPVIVRMVGTPTYDPATGIATSSDTEETVNGRLDEYHDRELVGTVKAGDRKLTLAAIDLTRAPTVSDKVVIASLEYDIVRVQSELATDQAAIYVVQLRR